MMAASLYILNSMGIVLCVTVSPCGNLRALPQVFEVENLLQDLLQNMCSMQVETVYTSGFPSSQILWKVCMLMLPATHKFRGLYLVACSFVQKNYGILTARCLCIFPG